VPDRHCRCRAEAGHDVTRASLGQEHAPAIAGADDPLCGIALVRAGAGGPLLCRQTNRRPGGVVDTDAIVSAVASSWSGAAKQPISIGPPLVGGLVASRSAALAGGWPCQLTRRRNQGEQARCLPCRVEPAAEGCGPPAEDVAWHYERLLDGATAASAVALAGTAVTIFRSRFCNVHSRISYYICSEHFRIVTAAAGTAAGLRSGRWPGRGHARVLERRVPPHVGP
jgi:hypothetical protein